jgi:hypothetical protein
MKALLAVLLAIATASCSGILPDVGAQSPPALPTPPTNLRKILLSGVHPQPPELMHGAQVAELHAARGAQPGDWMVCLKTIKVEDKDKNKYEEKSNSIIYIAAFIEGDKVIHFRRAVVIDDCESGSYSLLDPPVSAAVKPARKKK